MKKNQVLLTGIIALSMLIVAAFFFILPLIFNSPKQTIDGDYTLTLMLISGKEEIQTKTLDEVYQYGDTVEINFNSIEGYEDKDLVLFIYDDEILSVNVYQFIITFDTSITAVYKESDEYVALFLDTNNVILDYDYLLPGDVPTYSKENPIKPGMQFVNWHQPVTAIQEDVIYIATYHVINLTPIEVTSSTGVFNQENYIYNDIVVATPTNEQFTGWKNEYGNIVSFDDTYQFTALVDTHIEAFYDETMMPYPIVELKDVTGIRETHASYVGQIYFPENWLVIEYGLLLSDELTALTVDNATVMKSHVMHPLTNEFLRSIPLDTYKTVRAYAVFQTNDGFHVFYSNNMYYEHERMLTINYIDQENTYPQYVLAGQPIAESFPTKYGYTFSGWHIDEDLAVLFDFTQSIHQNLNLYAKWSEKFIQFSYDIENGSINIDEGTYSWVNPLHFEIDVKLGYQIDTIIIHNALYTRNNHSIQIDTFLDEAVYIQINLVPFSNLPIISIDTNDAPISNKSDYIAGTFDLYNSDEVFTSESMGIRLRGNSTVLFPKLPYRIRFDQKVSLFGGGSHRSWVLLADWLDISRLKNYAALNLSDRLSGLEFTPIAVHVNVYLNGEYLGMYLLSDQVQADEGRVGVEDDIVASNVVEVPFLVEIDEYAPAEGDLGIDYFNIEGRHYAIKYPSADERGNNGQFNYIRTYIETVQSLIKSDGNWEDYIEVNTFLDFYIVQELLGQPEINWKSIYMSKTIDSKLRLGPVWDFDWAVGGPIHFFEESTIFNPTPDPYGYDHWFSDNNWFFYLLDSPRFVELLFERWQEIQPIIDQWHSHLIQYRGNIKNDVLRELEFWDRYTNNSGILSFDGQYDYVLTYIMNKRQWMTTAISQRKTELTT